MQFTDDQIVIEPGHCQRTWQSCDYKANGITLFHERTFMRMYPRRSGTIPRERTPAERMWFAFGPKPSSVQWLPGGGTKAEIEKLAAKHGGEAIEEFYAPEGSDSYFLAFKDTDKALAFCRTPDFDALCLNLDKRA